MKVRVLGKYTVQRPLRSGVHKEVYEELYELSEQFIIWYRVTPYREGLNDRVKGFHSILHNIVQSEHALASLPALSSKPEVHILELDILDDGNVYDVYNIFKEDGLTYAEVEAIQEMSFDEYKSRHELNTRRLDALMKNIDRQNRGE